MASESEGLSRSPARHQTSPTERVDDVAPFNTTDRSQERARRLPPSFPNKCNGSPRRPRRQQDAPQRRLKDWPRCVSGTGASQKRNAAIQYPHPTHPARHPRHESDGRVAQGPDAASREHQTNHDPHQHERLPIGPRSHRRPPHTAFSATTPYQQQSRRPHASEMSYRSSPDGFGPQSELVVLPRPPNVLDAPRRARVSSERADRAASRPSLTPNGILPRRHHSPNLAWPPELSTARVA